MFLGAGSVMHGMNDQVDMRRFGGLSRRHEDHLGHLRPRLARDHRRPAVLRASGPRTRSSRRRSSARAGGRGCSAGPRCIGAGITAFYMSRLFFMTFHGKKRWTDDVHPHESPLAHDRPDDGARRRLGLPRPHPRPDRRHHHLARRRSSVPSRRASTRCCRAGAAWSLTLLLVARRRRAGLAALLARRRARGRARAARWPPGPPAATSTRTTSTRALFMRPGIHLTRSLVFADSTGRRRRRRWPGRPGRRHRPDGCAASRTASSGPMP